MALANLGQLALSDSLLQQVEKLDPAIAENAARQRQKIGEIQKTIDSLEQQRETDIKKISGEKDKNNPLKERKPKPGDEPLSADTRVKKLPKAGDRTGDVVESNQHKYKEAKFPPKDFKLEKPDQSGDIMLQKANADPRNF